MRISVTSTKVDEKPWNKNGRSGVIRTQEATAETRRWRNTVRLQLGNGDPIPPGEYDVDLEENVVVDQFGEFKLPRQLKLDAVQF